MNANELLIHLTERRVDSLFRTLQMLPADKLSWQPSPGARTALDQLQEVATAPVVFWSAYAERKVEWSDDAYANWKEERSKITSVEELEKLTRENTAKLVEFIRNVKPEEWTDPVSMPFPFPFILADVLAYHLWNMGYHEGQIAYIASLVE